MMASWKDDEVDAVLNAEKYPNITSYTVTYLGDQEGAPPWSENKDGRSLTRKKPRRGFAPVAAPIHDGESTVAALSVSTFANQAESRAGRGVELVDPLLDTAAAIDADLLAGARSR